MLGDKNSAEIRSRALGESWRGDKNSPEIRPEQPSDDFLFSGLYIPYSQALRFKRQRQRRDRSRRCDTQLTMANWGLVACDRPPTAGRRALIAHASPTLAAVVTPIEDPPEGGFAQLAAGRLTVGRPLHRMLCSLLHSIRDGRGERGRDGLRAEKASVLGLDSLLRVETCGQLSTEQLCGGR